MRDIEVIKYCLTEKGRIIPCEVGWGCYGTDGSTSCHDEPQEKNCRNLIDEKDVLLELANK